MYETLNNHKHNYSRAENIVKILRNIIKPLSNIIPFKYNKNTVSYAHFVIVIM